MKLTENEIRQLITEELDRQYLEQLDEGVGDYLKTAYNYYSDLGKKVKNKGAGAAVKTFAKDLSDVGATSGLEWVAIIPVLGAPAGIVALGLRIAAEEYLEAAIGALVTAAAQVGGGAAMRAGAAAGLPALLAGAQSAALIRAAGQVLARVGQAFQGIPRIGPLVVQGVARIQGQMLAKTAGNIASKKAEDKVLKVAEDNKKLMAAYEKVKNLPAAKQVAKSGVAKKGPSRTKVGSGEMFAGNRKDNINETIYNILKGVEPVKISRSSIRKLVKESIKKSGIVLGEAKQGGVTEGGVTPGGGLLLYKSDLVKLATGKELEVKPNRKMKEASTRIRIKLMGGKKTIATILKSLEINMAVFDKSVLEMKTDLGTNKAQPKTAKFETTDRGAIVYTSQGNKAELKIPAKGGDEDEGMERKTAVEPIIFAVDFDDLDLGSYE